MTSHSFVFQGVWDQDEAAAVQEFLVATPVEGGTPDIRSATIIIEPNHNFVFEVEPRTFGILGNDGDVSALNHLFQQAHTALAGSPTLVRARVGSSLVTLLR